MMCKSMALQRLIGNWFIWAAVVVGASLRYATGVKVRKLREHTSTHSATLSAIIHDPLPLTRVDVTGCRFVFLDIGASVGTHVRSVFEPSMYPKSKMLPLFDKFLGDPSVRAAPSEHSGVCAFGFEANPRFEQRFADIESAYAKRGWRAQLFAPYVASDSDGQTSFWINNEPTYNDWGSSVVNRPAMDPDIDPNRNFTERILPKINLAQFVNKYFVNNTKVERIMAKMDIEGSEYLVLPKMIDIPGLMCKGHGIDKIIIEWHDFKPTGCDRFCTAEAIKHKLELSAKASSCAATELVDLDDEVYLFDAAPLPK